MHLVASMGHKNVLGVWFPMTKNSMKQKKKYILTVET